MRLLFPLALAFVACGSSSSSSGSGGGAGSDDGSCNFPMAGLCDEYHGVPTGDWTTLANQCTSSGGSPTRGGSCASANRLGCCKYPGTSYTVQCSYPPRTANDQTLCGSQGGTWTPS